MTIPKAVQDYFDAWNGHDAAGIVACFADGGMYCDPSAGDKLPETRILDALWPDDEADAARNAFSTALSRLRRIAGRDLVRLEGGKLSLDTTRCWVDARAFETLLERATEPNAPRQAVELYHDKFLVEDAEVPWSMPMRERLQSRYAEALAQLAVAHQKAGDHEGAAGTIQARVGDG